MLLCSVTASHAFVSPPSLQLVPTRRRTMCHSHHTEFWGEERSHEEIKSHISNRLAVVAHPHDLTQRVEVVSAEPPLVVIHDFLSTSMCKNLIQSALDSDRMKRSTTLNSQTLSNTRTSSTTWLKDGECQEPLRLIADKVSSISGLPPSHMENLQVVKYVRGQQFSVHTDHNNDFNELECRGRLATCLIYLAEPDHGGETWFPGLTTEPKVSATRGSAVFFWNTMEKPGSTNYLSDMFLNADVRMRHAGLPVLEGEKWVCNRWVHPIDFKAGVRGLREERILSGAV